MEQHFFDDVRDAFEGFARGIGTGLSVTTHARGCKAFFGGDAKEHYEAQIVRSDGGVLLEIGFHAEHRDRSANLRLIEWLTADPAWRSALGDEPEVGDFIGNQVWQRISELWPQPDGDADDAIEVAARLADYARTFEPVRRSAGL